MFPEHIVTGTAPGKLLQAFLLKKDYTRIFVLLDEHTLLNCYVQVKEILPPHQTIIIPAGEEKKNLDTCILVWEQLTASAADRHSLLIVVGGGVLGDLGGFCAATYKRGIDFVLMPTTLLAQVDASIGGKLGIDFNHYKNHIGVFREPTSTLVATDFLKTLPLRELRSGFAEIIKHCLISDEAMWQKISSHPLNEQNWEALIRHSVAFKYSIISKDPSEKGLRKILNFGHTIGHAVESYSLENGDRLFHGEAIAIGMIAESYIAKQKGLINDQALKTISTFLTDIYGKVSVPETNALLPIIAQDKKNKGNAILMALPEGIGKAIWDVDVSEAEIKASMEYYRSF